MKTEACLAKRTAKLLGVKQYEEYVFALEEELRRRKKEEVKWWNEVARGFSDQVRSSSSKNMPGKRVLEIF